MVWAEARFEVANFVRWNAYLVIWSKACICQGWSDMLSTTVLGQELIQLCPGIILYCQKLVQDVHMYATTVSLMTACACHDNDIPKTQDTHKKDTEVFCAKEFLSANATWCSWRISASHGSYSTACSHILMILSLMNWLSNTRTIVQTSLNH